MYEPLAMIYNEYDQSVLQLRHKLDDLRAVRVEGAS
jgi:hypothetical protein